VLALAFGVLIVFLVMIGTIWIMAHMNMNVGMPPEMMNLHTQRG
jgi:cytochrome o ubiquinol oxidase operon protein cyoD